VRWFVLKEKITVSETQLKMFTALYPMNARPVQPVNARKIQQSQ
jgi:carbonic anhydrase